MNDAGGVSESSNKASIRRSRRASATFNLELTSARAALGPAARSPENSDCKFTMSLQKDISAFSIGTTEHDPATGQRWPWFTVTQLSRRLQSRIVPSWRRVCVIFWLFIGEPQ